MKKICIATWYGPYNYGTGLQAYALGKFLEKNGNDICFIGECNIKTNENDIIKYMEMFRESSIKKFYNNKVSSIKSIMSGSRSIRKRYHEDLVIKSKMQRKFVDNNFRIVNIKTKEELDKLNSEIDIFISGSDQIWNPYYLSRKNLLYMANDSVKRISYASSVGVESIPKHYKNIYKKYLNKYDSISVRELQSKLAIEDLVNKEINQVVDPTLLFDSNDWDTLADNACIDEKYRNLKYILCYFVGKRNTYWDYVELIKRTTGYEVIVLPINDESYKNNFKKYVKATPCEFLWLIKNASIVCTDSFLSLIHI